MNKQRPIPDKQRDLCDQTIHSALYCHHSCSLGDEPYLIPLAFGYDGVSIYLHTGQKGRKIEVWDQNPRVCLAFEGKVSLKTNSNEACNWSFEFQSVIGTGQIEEIRSPAEKEAALNQIMGHYSNQSWQFSPQELIRTRVWRIELDELGFRSHPSNFPNK